MITHLSNRYSQYMLKNIGVIFTLAILFVACTKTVAPPFTAQCSINGKPVFASTNYLEFDYYAGKFSSMDVNFITSSPANGYFDLHIGSATGNSFNSVYQTDSLSTGFNYSPALFKYTLDSINVIQSARFTINFSRISNNTVDGHFSGTVNGTDTTTSSVITDTITNGIFTNIPIHRVYH